MTMFHRTLVRAVALTTMSVAVATIGMQAASAGGYGGGFGGGYDSRYKGGYSGVPSHISHRRWGQHVDWCHEHFVTYREHDNTYQPYSGPRRKCWSPYISG